MKTVRWKYSGTVQHNWLDNRYIIDRTYPTAQGCCICDIHSLPPSDQLLSKACIWLSFVCIIHIRYWPKMCLNENKTYHTYQQLASHWITMSHLVYFCFVLCHNQAPFWPIGCMLLCTCPYVHPSLCPIDIWRILEPLFLKLGRNVSHHQ